jgi:TRAP-type mannitol/chloroaromatic compound transport system permease small subunit
MKRLISIIDSINEQVGRVVSFLVYPLAFLVCYEVVARYFVNKPTTWGFELQSFVFGASCVLGGGYTLLKGAHVNVPIVIDYCPMRIRRAISLCSYALLFFFAVVLFWKSLYFAWDSVKHLEHSWSVWSPPLYPVKLALPVGVLLLLIQGIACFARELMELSKRKEDE